MSWEHKILLLKVSRHFKNKKCIYIILSYKTIDYNTVKPPITATSLQWPFFGRQSIHLLLFQSLYNSHFLCPKVNAVVERFNRNTKTFIRLILYIAYFLGTSWNLILVRFLSSWRVAKATGYMESLSKWNGTPAGGSRKKFLSSVESASIWFFMVSSSLYPTHGGTAASADKKNVFMVKSNSGVKVIYLIHRKESLPYTHWSSWGKMYLCSVLSWRKIIKS